MSTTFAYRLRKAREAAGYRSAQSFADALGVEGARYRHWERGSAHPKDVATLIRVCRFLNLEVSDLVHVALKKKLGGGGEGRSAV